MIIEKNLSYMNTNHHMAFDYIKKILNEKSDCRILDIGAGANPWAMDYLTHIIDVFVEPNDVDKFYEKNIQVFNFDIQDSNNWTEVLLEVEKYGKFDFVICSHTLEDLNNPEVVCRLINKIGKAGFISMPSKYAELMVFENKNNLPYVGFHHHRWIYNIKNNILIGTPKMVFHNSIQYNNPPQSYFFSEIAFVWENDFDFKFLEPHQLLDNRTGSNQIFEILEQDDLNF